jgi:hypothetical protein
MNGFFHTATAEREGLETIHNTQRRDNSVPRRKQKWYQNYEMRQIGISGLGSNDLAR